MNRSNAIRRMPVGAEVLASGVEFRVWAPLRKSVEVIAGASAALLESEGNGYFSGFVPRIGDGTHYRFRLDGDDTCPDPASRFQPEGPHGPSEVVDSARFSWSDASWKGLALEGQVIYEMHIGTFTLEGTWRRAMERLPDLAKIGITVIEVMPIADFVGSFGWGYDGVNWFAPTRLYGRPDDLRAFVDRAHSLGMGVILDVVYNHFGSDGNYVGQFSPYYRSKDHRTDWGDALNYDGDQSAPVREFVISNAAYWIAEYHFDGLRLDATQDIFDNSPEHILADVTRAVRRAATGRETIVVAENEPQQVKLIRPLERGGYGIDGLWNDDYHHTAMVALSGCSDAYYSDYKGTPQEFLSAMKYGYLYQGQMYRWQKKRRGTPALDIRPSAFVTYIQNHDQIANSCRGERGHMLSSPALYRAITALMLLGPGTPMLFQGQEFGASSPFLYFADVPDSLRDAVRKGRSEFLAQWRALRMPEMTLERIDPCTPETFQKCKIDHNKKDPKLHALHTDLLLVRRNDPVMSRQADFRFDGAILSDRSFVYRVFSADHGDRLLVINLGANVELNPAPEPLLAPPEERQWEVLFSTEHPRYGGNGTPLLDTEENWRIPAQAAVLLHPVPVIRENA